MVASPQPALGAFLAALSSSPRLLAPGAVENRSVGGHHLQVLQDEGYGVLIALITHRHADPFVMQEASDRLHVPFYFMAAWQVFAMTHWMGRTVLRQHGCFSVNREGYDMPALAASAHL